MIFDDKNWSEYCFSRKRNFLVVSFVWLQMQTYTVTYVYKVMTESCNSLVTRAHFNKQIVHKFACRYGKSLFSYLINVVRNCDGHRKNILYVVIFLTGIIMYEHTLIVWLFAAEIFRNRPFSRDFLPIFSRFFANFSRFFCQFCRQPFTTSRLNNN
jgi:hypothetical protein